MFHMFVPSPPPMTPADLVYREKQPFGPYADSTGAGFANGVVLEVAETADSTLRVLRTCCRGWLWVVGVQHGFNDDDPDAPLVLALVPNPAEMQELLRICHQSGIEAPTVFSYIGVDPHDFAAQVSPLVQTSPLGYAGRSGV